MGKIVLGIALVFAGTLANSTLRLITTICMINGSVNLPKESNLLNFIGIICIGIGTILILLSVTIWNSCTENEMRFAYIVSGGGFFIVGIIGICTTEILRVIYDLGEMIFFGKSFIAIGYLVFGLFFIFLQAVWNIEKKKKQGGQ